MILGEVASALDEFLASAERIAPEQIAAMYLVGGAALDDFSPRLSNIDLVVVSDPSLTADQLRRMMKAEKALDRPGRPPELWYTTWLEIADGPDGRDPAYGPPPPLATPLTRSMLRNDAVAVSGPDWPVVAYDSAGFKTWCAEQLEEERERSEGMMLMRREVTSNVLQGARLAQGAITGRVFSKTEAGETIGPMVSSHFRRILSDTLGYRKGFRTSMYWGPFERKYDARVLLQQLHELVRAEK